MTVEAAVLAAERRFFAGLLEADVGALGRVLADDFILIDVMRGEEVSRAALLEAVGLRQVRFDAIEPAEARVRSYGSAAVVTGRTRMRGSFGGRPFAVHSRYTHVFVERGGHWRLVGAQGTLIVPAPETG